MAKQQESIDKDYEKLVGNLKGLGLTRLGVTPDALKRYRRQQRERYDKVVELLTEMNRTLLKQTPTNHIYLCNRAGEYVSVYSESETRVLAEPLDLAKVQQLSVGGDGTVNERLYRLIEDGKLAVRTDLTQAGGASVPTCAHLVHLDKKSKQAFFVGRDGQTEKLEKALFPFINLTARTRTLTADFGVAASVELLERTGRRLEHHFQKLAAAPVSEEKKPKKAHKSDSAKQLKKAAQKKAEAKKQLKKMSKKHKEKKLQEESKKRKSSDDEVPVPPMAEPPQQQASPMRAPKVPRLVITPKKSVSSSSSSSDSETTQEAVVAFDATDPEIHPAPALDHQMEQDLAWFSDMPLQQAVNAM